MSRALLLAVAAGLAGMVLLHADMDFELVAEVTGQSVERLQLASDSEAGSV